jgi:hypothetical protein
MLSGLKWFDDNQMKIAMRTIEKHYGRKLNDSTLVLQEIRNLIRKEENGTLDDGQEMLVVELERALL